MQQIFVPWNFIHFVDRSFGRFLRRHNQFAHFLCNFLRKFTCKSIKREHQLCHLPALRSMIGFCSLFFSEKRERTHLEFSKLQNESIISIEFVRDSGWLMAVQRCYHLCISIFYQRILNVHTQCLFSCTSVCIA